MDAHGGDGLKATEVEDPNTGERYLMYSLPIGWPGAPRIVYECPTCHGRFPPDAWSAGCPGCAEAALGGKKKKHKK
jgi:hypothetical protein